MGVSRPANDRRIGDLKLFIHCIFISISSHTHLNFTAYSPQSSFFAKFEKAAVFVCTLFVAVSLPGPHQCESAAQWDTNFASRFFTQKKNGRKLRTENGHLKIFRCSSVRQSVAPCF